MSLFKTITLPCPACGEEVEFDAVSSVNADRRPDLRSAILNGTFQSKPCGKCQVSFRLDPEMTYLHLGGHQWIIVYPFGYIGDWETLEARARSSFDRSYGSGAPRTARDLGADLQPRLVFGWAALQEKILIADRGLNDIEVELTKMAVLRSSEQAPIGANTELRLVDVKGDTLVMAWIVAETGAMIERMEIPRRLYDDIAGEPDWNALREDLTNRLFVDMQRMMLPVA
jgi:hypothetical protein